MKNTRKKSMLDTDVYTKAIERINYLYDRFDNVVVSFSGGKDSTAVLNCTIEVAKKRKKLPVKAIFIDEEAIHPPTIEYVERTMVRKEVELMWFCLPVKHRNACSNEQPYWYCWDPTEKDKWVRDLPKSAITKHAAFKSEDSFQEFIPKMFPNTMGTVCVLTGIRTQESLRRLRVILSKKNDAFITAKAEFKNTYRAHPIYDWSSEDVWIAVNKFGWDYNKTYDVFNQTKLHGKLLTQRVCPPYGEEPLRGLWVYAECFPEMWHKMLYRVKGVATAWRYANTELYSVGLKKPDDMTWKEYMNLYLEQYNEPEKSQIKQTVNNCITEHYNKTNDRITEDKPHAITGCCWKFICKVVLRGDFKGRVSRSMTKNSEQTLKKQGIDYEKAAEKYGKATYRQSRMGAPRKAKAK